MMKSTENHITLFYKRAVVFACFEMKKGPTNKYALSITSMNKSIEVDILQKVHVLCKCIGLPWGSISFPCAILDVFS